MKSRVLALVFLAACSRSHPMEAQAVASGQACATCHLDQFNGAANHAGTAPSPCENCHTTSSWDAVLHPEAVFPISSGAHRGIACADCHDDTLGTDFGGMNVNCTGCHSGTHSMARAAQEHGGVRNYVWSDTDKKFCLKCHPSGRGG